MQTRPPGYQLLLYRLCLNDDYAWLCCAKTGQARLIAVLHVIQAGDICLVLAKVHCLLAPTIPVITHECLCSVRSACIKGCICCSLQVDIWLRPDVLGLCVSLCACACVCVHAHSCERVSGSILSISMCTCNGILSANGFVSSLSPLSPAILGLLQVSFYLACKIVLMLWCR